jgi:hypothetical protein
VNHAPRDSRASSAASIGFARCASNRPRAAVNRVDRARMQKARRGRAPPVVTRSFRWQEPTTSAIQRNYQRSLEGLHDQRCFLPVRDQLRQRPQVLPDVHEEFLVARAQVMQSRLAVGQGSLTSAEHPYLAGAPQSTGSLLHSSEWTCLLRESHPGRIDVAHTLHVVSCDDHRVECGEARCDRAFVCDAR